MFSYNFYFQRIYGKQLETERVTYSSLKDNTGKMAFAPVVATTSSCHLDLRSHTEPQRWNFMSSTGFRGHVWQRKTDKKNLALWGEKRMLITLHFRKKLVPLKKRDLNVKNEKLNNYN
ncbi:hypothetical protein QQG55_30105 [Brugia pahangi]